MIKAIIERNYRTRDISIYLIEEKGDHNVFYYIEGEEIKKQEIKHNETGGKPFMILPDILFKVIMEGFINYANEKNIHTENENLLKGKLESVKYHLEDLRYLLKIKH